MSKAIHWEVPESLYGELVWAQEQLGYPNVVDFVLQAVQRRVAETKHEVWRHDLRQLQHDIRTNGGLALGDTKDEVVARLRETRQEVFQEEYASLY